MARGVYEMAERQDRDPGRGSEAIAAPDGDVPAPGGDKAGSGGPSPRRHVESGIHSVEAMVDAGIERMQAAGADGHAIAVPKAQTTALAAHEFDLAPSLTWRGRAVSDAFASYARRVAAGEDLPPFRGEVLAQRHSKFPLGSEPERRSNGRLTLVMLRVAAGIVCVLVVASVGVRVNEALSKKSPAPVREMAGLRPAKLQPPAAPPQAARPRPAASPATAASLPAAGEVAVTEPSRGAAPNAVGWFLADPAGARSPQAPFQTVAPGAAVTPPEPAAELAAELATAAGAPAAAPKPAAAVAVRPPAARPPAVRPPGPPQRAAAAPPAPRASAAPQPSPAAAARSIELRMLDGRAGIPQPTAARGAPAGKPTKPADKPTKRDSLWVETPSF